MTVWTKEKGGEVSCCCSRVSSLRAHCCPDMPSLAPPHSTATHATCLQRNHSSSKTHTLSRDREQNEAICRLGRCDSKKKKKEIIYFNILNVIKLNVLLWQRKECKYNNWDSSILKDKGNLTMFNKLFIYSLVCAPSVCVGGLPGSLWISVSCWDKTHSTQQYIVSVFWTEFIHHLYSFEVVWLSCHWPWPWI